MDFGIAAAADETHSTTGGLYGTAAYISPERAAGRRLPRQPTSTRLARSCMNC